MKKALKVFIKAICASIAIGLLVFEVYDMIRAKFDEVKSETWREAWNAGYYKGYDGGRSDVLFNARLRDYITEDEYDELAKG